MVLVIKDPCIAWPRCHPGHFSFDPGIRRNVLDTFQGRVVYGIPNRSEVSGFQGSAVGFHLSEDN